MFKDTRAQSLQPFLHTLQKDWVDYPIFNKIPAQLEAAKLLQVLGTLKALQQPGEELPSSALGAMWQSFSEWMRDDDGASSASQPKRLEVACNALKYLHHEAG